MQVRSFIARMLDVQAQWVANWLRSRSAFVWLVYGTVLWVPFVVFGFDPHGFLYLYIATSLSLITQVPLAMLAFWAKEEAHKNEELTMQTLQNQSDMMKLMLTKFGGFEEELGEIFEDIREMHHEEDQTQ